VVRCLKEGCPWRCGTRRTGACAERLIVFGLGTAFVVALIASLSWGLTSLTADDENQVPRPPAEHSSI
jgi:hypothetical protein